MEFTTLMHEGKFVDMHSLRSSEIKYKNIPPIGDSEQTIQMLIESAERVEKRMPISESVKRYLVNIKKCKVVKVRVEIIT